MTDDGRRKLALSAAEGTEYRRQETEDRRQRTKDGGQKTVGRREKYEKEGDLGCLGRKRPVCTGFYAKQSQFRSG
jgi:hypothetical protein